MLVDRKEAFDRKMKEKIQLKRAKEDVENLIMKGLKELQQQVKWHKQKEEQ